MNDFVDRFFEAPSGAPKKSTFIDRFFKGADEKAATQGKTEEVVFRDDKEGRVVRSADGALSYTSPGYATSDPEIIARIMGGTPAKEEIQRGFDETILDGRMGGARALEYLQGTLGVGEWLDEGVGMFNPGKAEEMRSISSAFERQHPKESAALGVAGGIVSTLPLAVGATGWKAADFVAKGATRATRAIRGGLIALPAAAADTASQFAGRAEPGSRGDAAMTGGIVGAGLGAALGGFMPLLGEGVGATAKWARGLDLKTLADEFGVSMPSARVLKSYLVNDDLASAMKVLQRNPDAMLAEAGPGTRQALDTAMATGGDALSTARPRVDARVKGAAEGWTRTVDDILGDAEGGIKGASKDIYTRSAPARQKAYDFAYSQPTPTTGAGADAIQDALDRINPKIMRSAVEKANDAMREKGLKNMNIMASIDDATGEVTFSQPLNIQQMDYIKRALGDLVEDGTDKLTGKMSSDAGLASRLAGRLGDALKEHVPGYARAMKLGGDTIKDTDALVLGRKLLSQSTTVEDVRNAMKGVSVTSRAAAKKGLRENLDAVMGQARATIADLEAGNVDFDTGQNAVAEAVAAMRNLTNRNNMTKARLILGSKADTLFKEMEKMSDALVLRAAVARNSATAIRQAGQAQMDSEVAPGMFRRAAGEFGMPLDSLKEVTRGAAGTSVDAVSQAKKQYYAEIADALTRIKGPEAERALVAVQKAMSGQPIKDADAELIARLTSGVLGGLGYQSGQQRLGPR